MFVGAGRIEVVDALARSFEGVVAGSGSRLVALSAPTGFGKSRIVQEFYARLAASQSVPAYWPARLEGDQASRWTESRKSVFPQSFVVPAGAELPWFWWGISCGKRQDGRYAQALFDDATQIAAHGNSLYDRMGGSEVAGRSFDGTNAIIGALGLLGVALVPPVAIGATIAGSLRTVWQNRDLLDRLSSWRSKREMRADGAALDAESHGRAAQIVDLAANVTTVSRKVPVVLIVDDAQWADATLVDFVAEVLGNPQARVLIVATTWPIASGDEQAGPFSKWLREALVAPRKSSRIEVRRLEGLGTADLAELVREEYALAAPDGAQPLSEAVTAAILGRVGGTPMGIRALFGLERTRRLIAGNGLTLQDLESLPRDLEHALGLYWDDVPKDIQTVLAIAAVAGFSFLPAPAVTAAAAQGVADGLDRLEQGENPYGFVRNVDTGLGTFIDPVFYDTAEHAADERFGRADFASIRQAIVDYALTISSAVEGPAVCNEAWSIHVRFASVGLSDRAMAARSAANLAELSAARFDYRGAIEQARRSLEWTTAPERDSGKLDLRHDLAGWLSVSGQLHDALETAQGLLETLLSMPESHDRDVRLVRVHLELATTLKRQQKLDAALDESRKAMLLINDLDVLDESGVALKRLVLRIYAGCLGESPETVGQAIDLLESLLADGAQPAMPDHEAMEIRQGLGSLYGDQRIRSDEHLAHAADVFRELRLDRERAFGADNPATLETTHSLAYVLAVSGPEFLPESRDLFSRVARERHRVLGPENPETLRTRHSVAWVTAEAGDIEAALAQYDALSSDSRSFLGPDHPDTRNVQAAVEHLRSRTQENAATAFLLANVLKPAKGETPQQLRARADDATLAVPEGAAALALMDQQDPERAQRYRSLTWRKRQLPLSVMRVWPSMGGLPDSWCQGSVVDTANHLRHEEVPGSAPRLEGLLALVNSVDRRELIDWLSYLPLIVVPDAMIGGRPAIPGVEWVIDDGCHRAVMLGLLDVDSAAVLVGEPA
jgi:tetratricopeptide (TPR) repeat protein